MAITQSTVTGPVQTPLGGTPDRGYIRFQLTDWDNEGGEVITTTRIEAPISVADQDFSVSLWATSEGERGVNYRVTAVWYYATNDRWIEDDIGWCSVGDNGPYQLGDILVDEPITPTSASVLALAQLALTEAEAAQAAAEALDITSLGASESASKATNSAVFSTLISSGFNSIVDLQGLVLPVTAIPNLRCRNGFFEVTTGGVEVCFAAEHTLRFRHGKITNSRSHTAWTQDTVHFYGDTWFVLFKETGLSYVAGDGQHPHSALDGYTWCVRSKVGDQFVELERLDFGYDDALVWAAGIHDGQQFFVVREIDEVAPTSANTQRLFARRLFEQKRGVTAQIEAIASSNVYRITLADHGVKVGDSVRLLSLSANIGGVDPSRIAPYSVVDVGQFTFDLDVGTVSSDETGDRDFLLEFVEEAPTELLFDSSAYGGSSGQRLGQAFADFWQYNSIDFSDFGDAIPITIHSMIARDSDSGNGSSGKILTGVHAQEPWILTLEEVLRPERYVSALSRIGTVDDGAEPCIAEHPGEGKDFGTLRGGGSQTGPMRFFHCDTDDFANATVTAFDALPFAEGSPASIAVDTDNDVVYIFCTDDRQNLDVSDNPTRGPVNMYLLWASVTDAVSTGASAFKKLYIGQNYFNQESPGTNVVGVGSMAYGNGKLLLTYTVENYASIELDKRYGTPDVHYTEIDVSSGVPMLPARTESFGGHDCLAPFSSCPPFGNSAGRATFYGLDVQEDVQAKNVVISNGSNSELRAGMFRAGIRLRIADDSVATITPPQNGGFLSIMVRGDSSFVNTDVSGIVMFDVGGSIALTKIGGGANLDVLNGTVSGTTGDDAHVTIGAAGGDLRIENRTGGEYSFDITFF